MPQKPKLLLLQIRNADDPMRHHEVKCFLEATRLAPEQLVPFDCVTQPFDQLHLEDYDALLVGGSGEYSVARSKAPFLEPMKAFLGGAVDQGFPTFASCFGFHVIAEALGGTVVTDPENMEVGTFELELTEAGRADSVFSSLGNQFPVQMGHKDRLDRIPEGVEVLSRGEQITCQAFRVPGVPVWGAQFHPELTAKTNQERYLHYFSVYPGEEPDPAILSSFRESPQADELIARFLDEIF